MMQRAWAVALFLCVVLFSLSDSEAKKGDDSKWNLPSNTNNHNNSNANKNKKDKKKSKSSKKKSKHDNSKSTFQTSLTFIPQQDLADPKLMNLINSPWNDKGKKDKLQARLSDFVRENLVDQDKVDQLTKRTRKEWEDMDVAGASQMLQGLAKIMTGMLSSPGVQKLLEDREAQEKIRLFLIGVSVQIRMFLNDPKRQQLLASPEQWQALFEKIKAWEGAPHEQVIEEVLDFIDQRTSGD